MCAIFGILGDYDRGRALEAFSSLSHRGPDASATIEREGLYVGAHRLAITGDLENMDQPRQENGRVVLFNGEIYNHQELARELGLNDRDSETRLILAAYGRWGEEFASRLEGMYAIALIEEEGVRLYRDPFGKKPLYFFSDASVTVFGSEARAVATILGVSHTISTEALADFMFFQSPLPPFSFYRGVEQLSPGEMVICAPGGDIHRRYFRSCLGDSTISDPDAYDSGLFLERLERAVRVRIPSRLKWGSLLSGGIDSSLVSALAARQGSVDTFCVGYEGYEKYDERRWASIVSAHIGSTHHDFVMGMEDFLESVDEFVSHIDEPIADPAAIPLWFLMKRISAEGFRVVLTGDGSDELFLGYRLYREYFAMESAGEMVYAGWLKNYLRSNFSMNREWERYKRRLEGSLLFRSTAELFSDLQTNRFLRTNIRDDRSAQRLSDIRRRFEESGRRHPLDWYSFCDIHSRLSELYLKKLDRVSMAFAIEGRTPFLDTDTAGYIFGLDPTEKISGEIKALLKKSASLCLPSEVLQREKKGFSYPFFEWLEESGELSVIEKVLPASGLFRPEAIRSLLEKGGRKRFKHHIYALYILSRWMRAHGFVNP